MSFGGCGFVNFDRIEINFKFWSPVGGNLLTLGGDEDRSVAPWDHREVGDGDSILALGCLLTFDIFVNSAVSQLLQSLLLSLPQSGLEGVWTTEFEGRNDHGGSLGGGEGGGEGLGGQGGAHGGRRDGGRAEAGGARAEPAGAPVEEAGAGQEAGPGAAPEGRSGLGSRAGRGGDQSGLDALPGPGGHGGRHSQIAGSERSGWFPALQWSDDRGEGISGPAE